MNQSLWETVVNNLSFVSVILITVAVLAAIAWAAEKNTGKRSLSSAQRVALVGVFSALAFIIQFFEFPLIFIAPDFYKLDFSEVPVMIAGFSLGPVAAVMTELLKNLIKVLIRGTSTAFVGDYANFLIGCSLVLPAAIIYQRRKTRKRAMIGCAAGTIVITIFGTVFNALYLLPAYARLYGTDISVFLERGQEIHPGMGSFTIQTFVMICVAPINLIKGIMVSVLVLLIYKPVSRLMHQIAER